MGKISTSSDDSSALALRQQIAALEAELEGAARRFLEQEERQQRELDELQQLLRADSPLAVRTRASLEETKYALQSAEQRLHGVTELYESLAHSASWRYTKPVRALARLLHGDRELFADGLWNQVRAYAEHLPRVRERAADRATYGLIVSLSPLLKQSTGYQRWHETYLAGQVPQPAGAALNSGNFAEEIARLKFPAAADPVISIIIPAYGNLKFVLGALRSLSVFPPSVAFEVIVADDASGEQGMQLLCAAKGLSYLKRTEPIGIIGCCNEAARSARGTYLFLMGSDTELATGTLDQLLKVFSEHAEAGLVGAKLVYRDTRLEQAGGIVWRDASAENFGKLEDSTLAAYNVLRETDYCSGAASMISRALFESLGGLDQSYTATGYEDIDLCFKVRQAGRKVIYQPAATVFRHDQAVDVKNALSNAFADQLVDQNKFKERWALVLERDHFAPGTSIFHAKDRSRHRPCLLVIDHSIPAADRDAGSRSLIQFMMAFLHLGLSVKFWPQDGLDDPHYRGELEQAGIEVLLEDTGPESFAIWYQAHAEYIDHVLLSRPHVSVEFMPVLKSTGHAQILFYGHDIHYQRIAMQIEAGLADASAMRSLELFKKLEPQLWPQMDVIYYPSESETKVVEASLARSGAKTRVRTVPVYAFDSFPSIASTPGERSGLLFVAGFKHAPNADGVIWFKEHVLPLILERLPKTHLTIAGSNPGASVTALAGRSITVTGFISDQQLERAYASCRVCIAPLRFGAGMKGKVAEALRFGVPLVTTEVGLQGLEDAAHAVFVTSDPQTFADRVMALLEDDNLWSERSAAAQAFARQRLSRQCLQQIFALDVQGSA